MNGSKWFLIIFIMFCNDRIIYRVKLVRWIFNKCMGAAFAGCETHPIPINLTKRLIWYIRRVIGLYRLYKMMIDHYESNERVKGKGKSP